MASGALTWLLAVAATGSPHYVDIDSVVVNFDSFDGSLGIFRSDLTVNGKHYSKTTCSDYSGADYSKCSECVRR